MTRSRKNLSRTKELQSLWWDWLSTAERALHALYEQNAALVIRDFARIDKIQPEIDKLITRMEQVDRDAAALAIKLAEELGAQPNLRSLLSVLEQAEAQRLQSIANRVKVVGANLKEQLRKNKALIESEMSYISGTLTLIAKVAQGNNNKGPYGNKVQHDSVLMDQRT